MKHSTLRRKTAVLLVLVLVMALFAQAAYAIDGIVSIQMENNTVRAYVKGARDHTIVLPGLAGIGGVLLKDRKE
ncbi:MAG: hypothetical protein ABS897_04510 [Eubacteriales bacterium]